MIDEVNIANASFIAHHFDLDTVFDDIRKEYGRAMTFGDYNSAHEGYAVILEEMDELWDHVKMNQKKRDMIEMRKEAIQLATTAIKFITNICDKDNRR